MISKRQPCRVDVRCFDLFASELCEWASEERYFTDEIPERFDPRAEVDDGHAERRSRQPACRKRREASFSRSAIVLSMNFTPFSMQLPIISTSKNSISFFERRSVS